MKKLIFSFLFALMLLGCSNTLSHTGNDKGTKKSTTTQSSPDDIAQPLVPYDKNERLTGTTGIIGKWKYCSRNSTDIEEK